MKVIYSFCDYSGVWSQPYVDAGYLVRRFDLKNGDDVRLLEWRDERVHGILCAPPCTVFANSGARWPRTEAEMLEGLSIVDACYRACGIYNPKWFVLENPIGKLKRYLGPPQMYFNPCDYGGYLDNPETDAYTKRTCLWGYFNQPVKKPVPPVHGSKMHTQYGGKSERTKEARSVTPAGFARAFFAANP